MVERRRVDPDVSLEVNVRVFAAGLLLDFEGQVEQFAQARGKLRRSLGITGYKLASRA
jgi:hypothetical protein